MSKMNFFDLEETALSMAISVGLCKIENLEHEITKFYRFWEKFSPLVKTMVQEDASYTSDLRKLFHLVEMSILTSSITFIVSFASFIAVSIRK